MITDREPVSHKVVILGNSGVGKTSIINYAINSAPLATSRPTIGANCSTLRFSIDDQDIQLRVWDTAGQEFYRSIVPIYVRDAFAAVLVYDLTNQKSFDALDHWRSVVVEEQSGSVVIFVVCNKIDLPNGVVLDGQAAAFSQNVNAKFHKVSAISGAGIRDLFEAIARQAAIGNTHQAAPPTFRIEQERAGTRNCC